MSLLISLIRIRSFASAHESVTGSFVGDQLILLPCRLHRFRSSGNGRANTRIIPGIEAIDRLVDRLDRGRVGARAVEDESCVQVRAGWREGEGFAASPAEANHRQLAV